MKMRGKKILSTVSQSLLIAFIVILIVCPLSCKITTEGVAFVTGDYVAPKLEEYSLLDGNHIFICFSENVNLDGIVISKKNDSYGFGSEGSNNLLRSNKITNCDNEGEYIIEFGETATVGEEYVLGGIVEDKVGNTLTFSLPFVGYNPNIPDVIITEFFNESTTISKKTNKCRNEYVKLLALEDGNLFGLSIGSASWTNKDAYYFPPINVKKGEEFIVHFNIKGEGCISETGDDLNLASELTAINGVRDLWFNNTKSVFGNTTDVIFVKNNQTGLLIDGFPYFDNEKTEWTTELREWAIKLKESEIYNSELIADAVNIKPISSTNPLVRKDILEIKNKLNNNEKIIMPRKTNNSIWVAKKSL